MNTNYRDITSRIPEPPKWFDEHAVPRFVDFDPMEVANIYANQVCLVRITCQGCGQEFKVAFSQHMMDRFMGYDQDGKERWIATLEEQIQRKSLHYGDPPNVDCCGAGATMNSEPREVLEFWERNVTTDLDWHRRPDLEVNIEPDWVRDESAY